MDEPINKTDIYLPSSHRKFIKNSAWMIGGSGVFATCKPQAPLAESKQLETEVEKSKSS